MLVALPHVDVRLPVRVVAETAEYNLVPDADETGVEDARAYVVDLALVLPWHVDGDCQTAVGGLPPAVQLECVVDGAGEAGAGGEHGREVLQGGRLLQFGVGVRSPAVQFGGCFRGQAGGGGGGQGEVGVVGLVGGGRVG